MVEVCSAGSRRCGRVMLVLKRILWWAGLVLLLPAPAVFYDWDTVRRLFASLPPRLDMSTTDADHSFLMMTLAEERVLAALVAGSVCWVLCAILGVVVLLPGSVRPASWHPVRRVVRGLIAGRVSFVFLLSASFAGLVIMAGTHV